MKLYYFTGAPTLGAHISLREAEIEPELVQVDFTTMLVDGQPFAEVNPKGYVPALILDDGSMLTENVAILDWIAQQSPSLRPSGPMERTRLIEMLAFISTELHKQFLALFFLPGEEAKPVLRQTIEGRFTYLAGRLGSRYLFGDRFSTADAFLYAVLRGATMAEIRLPAAFDAYCARIEARPAVRAALEAEGIAPLVPA
ncbi:MAG: glutathione S-transferase N-terminal domain-containing protein [Mesorhizobium sp.]|nr:glutathione S-transferase N-terminal domain-containing protein [Mesorhizobium sp.]